MPHSLRAELSKLRYKQTITDDQYKKYIRTLDRYKAYEEIVNKIRSTVEEKLSDSDYLTSQCPFGGYGEWYDGVEDAKRMVLEIIDSCLKESTDEPV